MENRQRLNVTIGLVKWSVGPWLTVQITRAAERVAPVYRGHANYYWRNGRSANELSAQLRQIWSFRLVQAAWQISSPTDQEVLALTETLLGSPSSEGVQILSDAIIIAGSPAGSTQRKAAERRALLAAATFYIENPLIF
jgi:hypothetical protein